MDSKELLTLVYKNREYRVSHLPYDREMAFYRNIQLGNKSEVERLFKPLDSDGLGRLSRDEVRNLKYHLVITVAFITRYCIEGGLEMEEAYTLSDAYINRIDLCNSTSQIKDIHRELVLEYTKRMERLRKKTPFSKPVMKGIDYIYDNLHSRLTLDEVAAAAGCSPTYFSRHFHSEVGVTLKTYINEKKIDEAKLMLSYTDYSVAQIASVLYFATESHFAKLFKEFSGVTPSAYRKLAYRKRRASE